MSAREKRSSDWRIFVRRFSATSCILRPACGRHGDTVDYFIANIRNVPFGRLMTGQISPRRRGSLPVARSNREDRQDRKRCSPDMADGAARKAAL
jgi:hypothetical protein